MGGSTATHLESMVSDMPREEITQLLKDGVTLVEAQGLLYSELQHAHPPQEDCRRICLHVQRSAPTAPQCILQAVVSRSLTTVEVIAKASKFVYVVVEGVQPLNFRAE